MVSRTGSRLAAWAGLMSIAAFFVWVTLVPYGYRGTPIAVAMMTLMLFAILIWGADRSSDLWTAVEPPQQVRRVLILIAAAIGIQLTAAWVLQLTQQLNWMSATLLSMGTWIGLMGLCLATGFVRWPKRRRSPTGWDIARVAIPAVLVAALFCYLTTLPLRGAMPQRLPGGLPTDVSAVAVAATVEEIVFRVLLLTALLTATGSRFQALVLSSILFAVGHVPLALAGPLFALDGTQMIEQSRQLAPEMVWKIGFGFLFGALWLRTGSLVLIALAHALANLGPVLAIGFIALVG